MVRDISRAELARLIQSYPCQVCYVGASESSGHIYGTFCVRL
jgi:hypothetical protein